MSHRSRRSRQQREERERAEKAAERKRILKLAAIVGVVVLVVAGLGYLIANNPGGTATPGAVAPDFTLVDSDGNSFRLSQFRGKPVVLFFMTSSDWCQPCKVETRDHLKPLFDTYGNRIQIISIELLPNDRSNADLNAYKATYDSPWIYARDTGGVGGLYGIQALSTIVILDHAGYIQYRGTDPSFDQMAEVLRRLGL